MASWVCGTWDLVPWPGIIPRPPELGAWSLNHLTTREVLKTFRYFTEWTAKYKILRNNTLALLETSQLTQATFWHNNSFSIIKWSEVAQLCPTLRDPMDCSPPGSSVTEFLRQDHWNSLPFPPPGDLPHPGIEPGSPTLQADTLPSE